MALSSGSVTLIAGVPLAAPLHVDARDSHARRVDCTSDEARRFRLVAAIADAAAPGGWRTVGGILLGGAIVCVDGDAGEHRFVVTGLLMSRATRLRLQLLYGFHAVAAGLVTCVAGPPAPETSTVSMPASVMVGRRVGVAVQLRDSFANHILCSAALAARLCMAASVTIEARVGCTVAAAWEVSFVAHVSGLLVVNVTLAPPADESVALRVNEAVTMLLGSFVIVVREGLLFGSRPFWVEVLPVSEYRSGTNACLSRSRREGSLPPAPLAGIPPSGASQTAHPGCASPL